MITRKDALKLGGAVTLGAAAAPFLSRRSATAASTVIVDFWNWWHPPRQALIDQLIHRFEAKYPGISIHNNVRAWAHQDEQTLTALISTPPPGLIMLDRSKVTGYATKGVLTPLDAYIKSSSLDLGAFLPASLGSFNWKGQLYALPIDGGDEYSMMVYNTDLFRKAGLNPARPPRTWQQFETAIAALTKRGPGGKLTQIGADLLYTGYAYQFVAYLYTNNGSLYSRDMKKIAFNSPEGVATLQFMLTIMNKYYGGIQNYLEFMHIADPSLEDDSDPKFPWYQGKIGMFPVGFWTFFLTNTLGQHIHYDVAARPYNGANPTAGPKAAVTGSYGYAIPRGLSPDVEKAAFQFLAFFTANPQGSCAFEQAQGRPSAIKSCNASPAYERINPYWSKVQQLLTHDVTVPLLPPHLQIMDRLDHYLSLPFLGKMGAQQALNSAASEAQHLLDQFWSSNH